MSKKHGSFMRALSFGAMSLFASSVALVAQQPSVVVKGDDVTIRGCVGRAPTANFGSQPFVIWSRSDIMLKNVSTVQAGQAAPLGERVFYWLNDDEDIARHVGQMVEIKGDLGEFKRGEVEVDRDGDFTDIKMKIGDRTEKARVPSAWLSLARGEGEFDIATRKIDVDDVKVIGACPA
jgi:hypothetical protein